MDSIADEIINHIHSYHHGFSSTSKSFQKTYLKFGAIISILSKTLISKDLLPLLQTCKLYYKSFQVIKNEVSKEVYLISYTRRYSCRVSVYGRNAWYFVKSVNDYIKTHNSYDGEDEDLIELRPFQIQVSNYSYVIQLDELLCQDELFYDILDEIDFDYCLIVQKHSKEPEIKNIDIPQRIVCY